MEKRMTNKIAVAYVLENCDIPADVREKLEKLLESFDKKSNNGEPTERQKENEELKQFILDYLETADAPKTCTELEYAIPELTGKGNQRIARLMKDLTESGRVERTKKSGKSLFSIV